MKRITLAIGLLLAVAIGINSAAGQQLTSQRTNNPAHAAFVYQDIENFLAAQQVMSDGADSIQTLQTHYLDKASLGLVQFIEKYDLTAQRILAAMRKYPESYSRLDSTLLTLKTNEQSFRETYADLQSWYSEATFPPTYFVVAGHRGIGSGSIEGPLISIEKKTQESIQSDLPATLVHEMIHMQQLAALGDVYFEIFSGEGRTLLALSIREGASTFFSELIEGGSYHKNLARTFLMADEETHWREFELVMNTDQTAEWLWDKPSDPNRPQDLGYAMGARIVEHFYVNAIDKVLAAKTIMSITDYVGFLAQSGYSARFD